jgi:hypothetical protein
MSSNSSSPVEEKNFLTEDSADVPILAVTAELPVGDGGGGATPTPATHGRPDRDEDRLVAAPGDDDDESSQTRQSAAPGRKDDGPGAEPAPTDSSRNDAAESDLDLASPSLAESEFGAETTAELEAKLDVDVEAALAAAADDKTPVPLDIPEAYTQAAFARESEPSETMPSPFETTSDDIEAVSLEDAGVEAEDDDSSPDVMTSAVLPMGDPARGRQAADELPDFDEATSALDASDLVIEGENEAPSPPTPAPVLGPGDEDFLRRVVLPPLPLDARPAARFGEDHTVISEPPSPELLASMAIAPRAPSAAPLVMPQSHATVAAVRAKRVRLTIPQFGVLMVMAVVLGAFLPGQLRAILPAPVTSLLSAPAGTAPAEQISAPVAPERAPAEAKVAAIPTPAAPEKPAAEAPVVTPSPTAAAPASSPPPAPAAPPVSAQADATVRPAAKPTKAGPAKRIRRAKRAPKKAFVDPFE